MNETDELIDEILGDEEVKIPVNDKRRFSPEGERTGGGTSGTESKEPQITPREVELEARLKEETTRREAAESKLVGVQAKFEEAKASLEKETADMRARLKKTLEDRAKQSQFDFLKTLLPVLDNLNLAISASETDPSIDHLREGVVGTARSFEQALLSVGVEPVPGVGTDFDPEVQRAVKDRPDLTLAAFAARVPPAALAELLGLLESGAIGGPAAKQVFERMAEQGGSPKAIVDGEGLARIADEGALEAMVDAVLAAHPAAVAEYRAGKAQTFGFLVGQVMKASNGRADAGSVNALLKKKL